VACPSGISDISDVYEQWDEIGRGSFGIVRAARHKQLGQMCVVKNVDVAGAGNDYVIQHVTGDMFTHLLKMSQDWPHKNVIKYLDFLLGPAVIFVVMEELIGDELFRYMQEHAPLKHSSCQCLMKQVCSAVAHIHAVGIVHRDVKIEAFRFRNSSPEADLVLFDFGHCCYEGDNIQRAVIGTSTYMAPEQFSRWYSTPVDVWACGVVFYIMISGRLPFKQELGRGAAAPTAQDLALAMSIDQVTKLSSNLIGLLTSLLELNPQRRSSAMNALEHIWFVSSTDAHITAEDFGISKDSYLEAERSATQSTVFSYNERVISPKKPRFAPFVSPAGLDIGKGVSEMWRPRAASTEELLEALESQNIPPGNLQHDGTAASLGFIDDWQTSTEVLRDCYEAGPNLPKNKEPPQSSPGTADWYNGASTEVLQDHFAAQDTTFNFFAGLPQPDAKPADEDTQGQVQRFVFQVPQSKLTSRENIIVLQMFDVDFEGMKIPFRVHVRARKVHHKRFGQSFRTAQGKGFLELKCETSVLPPASFLLRFAFGIGNNCSLASLRGAVTHDFISGPIGCLPSGDDLWDFKEAVDPASKCFSVCLEVRAG
jgi:serine/threonine protein kinase